MEQPVQRIAAAEDEPFSADRARSARAQQRAEANLHRLSALEARATFDLETGPLIRGRLIRLAEDEHALLITMHHIVSDGWSMGVLRNELSALYSAFVRGEADPLPELDIQYADYAVWQRRVDRGRDPAATGRLLEDRAGRSPGTAGVARGSSPSGAAGIMPAPLPRLVLDEQLTAGLKDLSRRHGTTLFMTLLAAWAALLSRLSGQQDVVIGTPTANRGRAEIENLIGFFVNTLAVRLDLSGSPTCERTARSRPRRRHWLRSSIRISPSSRWWNWPSRCAAWRTVRSSRSCSPGRTQQKAHWNFPDSKLKPLRCVTAQSGQVRSDALTG